MPVTIVWYSSPSVQLGYSVGDDGTEATLVRPPWRVVTDGSQFEANGGIDGYGFAFSATALPSPFATNGFTFQLASPNGLNVVSSQGQSIPVNRVVSKIALLATPTNNSGGTRTFSLNYSDGSSQPVNQNMSNDWCISQSVAGESVAVTPAYRNQFNGTMQYLSCSAYTYTLDVNTAKTLSSISLPNSYGLKIIAISFLQQQ